jgi:hypothetical protein
MLYYQFVNQWPALSGGIPFRECGSATAYSNASCLYLSNINLALSRNGACLAREEFDREALGTYL